MIKRLTKKKGELKKIDKLFIQNAKATLFDNSTRHGKVHLLARFIQSDMILKVQQWKLSVEQLELKEEERAADDLERASSRPQSAVGRDS